MDGAGEHWKNTKHIIYSEDEQRVIGAGDTFEGFLEHFRADFDGPNRVVTSTAGAGLPAVTAP